jgi:hypothetical protein
MEVVYWVFTISFVERDRAVLTFVVTRVVGAVTVARLTTVVGPATEVVPVPDCGIIAMLEDTELNGSSCLWIPMTPIEIMTMMATEITAGITDLWILSEPPFRCWCFVRLRLVVSA